MKLTILWGLKLPKLNMGIQDRHQGDDEEKAVGNGDTQAAQIWNFCIEYKTQI